MAVLVDPVWLSAGSMSSICWQHTATLLPSGQVLVAGGADTAGPLSSVEIYDPAKNAWQVARALIIPRSDPVGALLDDGSVLLAGGVGEGGIPLVTAELYTLFANGTLCDLDNDCKSGFCVNAVCCDTACAAGPCDVCSASTDVTPLGTKTPGTCRLLTGPTCDDGDLCTQTDTCQAGVCTGANPVVCPTPDPCRTQAACNPKTGECGLSVNKDDNTSCDDGNDCTAEDRCQGGVCTGTKDNNCLCPECSPYVCHGASRTCTRPCASVNDCATGYVCDQEGQCVPPPPDRASLEESACAISAPGAQDRAPGFPWALSLFSLGALAARRRGGSRRSAYRTPAA